MTTYFRRYAIDPARIWRRNHGVLLIRSVKDEIVLLATLAVMKGNSGQKSSFWQYFQNFGYLLRDVITHHSIVLFLFCHVIPSSVRPHTQSKHTQVSLYQSLPSTSMSHDNMVFAENIRMTPMFMWQIE